MRTMKLTLISIGVFACVRLFAQTSDKSIAYIKIYVRVIDSLSEVRTEDARLITRLDEGYISTTKKSKFKSSGFSLETVTSVDGDTVFLIRHSDSLEKYLIKSYYFKSDKLVFSRIEVKDDDSVNATLFRQEEYYKDDKVILSTVDKNELKKKYKWRTDFDHKANGYYYLKDYINGRPSN
jgi:hypothetical protein